MQTPKAQRKLHRQRLRGSLLLEAVLALAVAMSLVGISASYIASESDKQERMMIASEQDVILEAARNYVQERYHDVLQDLYTAADGSGEAIVSYTMDDLIEAGFLPSSYRGGIIKALYTQEYAMLARAVNRMDAGAPQATMTFADIDPAATGAILPALSDGDGSNGEMDIEAILVSHGGDPMPPGVTGDVIGMMRSAFSGVVSKTGNTSGAYENFNMDITAFEPLDEYPIAGHFAGVVSLSSYGILGSSAEREFVIDPFQRCVGVNIASAEYADCIASNEVYTDLVLRPYDSDNNGSVDKFPAMRNVTFLDCADATGNGAINSFTIDCSTTRITGDLNVEGDNITLAEVAITPGKVAFQGRDLLSTENIGGSDKTNVTGGRIVTEAVNGGLDLSETVSDSRTVPAGSLVDMPTCPAVALDGSPMKPRIYLSPAGYADPGGRAIVGVRAYSIEETATSQWRVQLGIYVAEDLNVDNQADYYELDANYGAVVAQTRCY